MNIEDLRKPLSIDDIDFRIQSINKGGYATILAYKDARVDINRLDEVCGALGWKREHVRDNHNCIVSIWDASNKQWVSKEDTGTESNTEQQKGLASDSFKRACFNWGIGIELYDYPSIRVKLNGGGKEPKGVEWYMKDDGRGGRPSQGYELKLKEWVWGSSVDKSGKVKRLYASDQNGKVRFYHGKQLNDTSRLPREAAIEWAYDEFRKLVDRDEDTPEWYAEFHEVNSKLTPDEAMLVLDDFGKEKPVDSKRMYRSLINSALAWKPEINETEAA